MAGVAVQVLLVVGPALTGQASPLTRAPAAGEPTPATVTVVQFNPPVEISIRTKQRNVLRGSMLSFDEKTVQIQTRVGKVISYPTARIRTLRTRDGRFSWKPGSETFETARKKAEMFQAQFPMTGIGVPPVSRRGSPLVPRPRRIGPLIPKPMTRPPTRPSPTAPTPAGTPRIPGAIRPGQPATSEPVMPADTGTSPRYPQPAAEPEGKICPNCQRAVPASLADGNYCPYCGVRWSDGGHPPVGDRDSAHHATAETTPVRLPPGTSETGPMSWHQMGRKYWWVGMVLLVGWAVWLLRS